MGSAVSKCKKFELGLCIVVVVNLKTDYNGELGSEIVLMPFIHKLQELIAGRCFAVISALNLIINLHIVREVQS